MSDWAESYSEKHKRKYWKNKTTGKTSWSNPDAVTSEKAQTAAESSGAAATAATDADASEWAEAYSEKHKRKYWKNKTTGKMSWTDPTEVAAATAASATATATATGAADTEWAEAYSEKHKRKYWKHKTTGKMSWTNPSKAAKSATAVASAASADASDAAVWVESYSEKHKRKYWKNSTTGKTSWTHPAKSDVASEAAANAAGAAATATVTGAADTEWAEAYSEKHKRKYWKNKTTGKTSWTAPAATAAPAAATAVGAVGAVGAGAEEWVESYSEKHKRKYWKNKATGKSSWTAPAAATAPAATAPATTAPATTTDDWVELYSEKHKRKYWKNKTSGKTSWTAPAKKDDVFVLSANTATAAGEAVASEWVELYSEKHKRKYWKNKTTGKTSWTAPAPSAPAASSTSDAGSVAPSSATVGTVNADDWVESYSDKHKRKYWKNKSTGKTSWKAPDASVSAPATATSSAPAPTSTSTSAAEAAAQEAEVQKALALGAVARGVVDAHWEGGGEHCLLQLEGSGADTKLVLSRFTATYLTLARSHTGVAAVAAAGTAVGAADAVAQTEVVRCISAVRLQSMVCNQTPRTLNLVVPMAALTAPPVPAPACASASVASLSADSSADATAAQAQAGSSSSEAKGGEEKEDQAQTSDADATTSPSVSLSMLFPTSPLAQLFFRSVAARLDITPYTPEQAQAQAVAEAQVQAQAEVALAQAQATQTTNAGTETAIGVPAAIVAVIAVAVDYTPVDTVGTAESHSQAGVCALSVGDALRTRLEVAWLLSPFSGASGDGGSAKARALLTAALGRASASAGGGGGGSELPQAGLLLFKVLRVSEGGGAETHELDELEVGGGGDGRGGGWMTCWVSMHASRLTFFDQGPHCAPSLCVDLSHTTVHLPDLTEADAQHELVLLNTHSSSSSSTNNPSTRTHKIISLAVKLPTPQELFRWTVAFAAAAQSVTYIVSGVLRSATPADLTLAPSSRTQIGFDGMGFESLAGRPYVLEACFAALEVLAERRMCAQYLRSVSLTGAQVKSARFLQINQRLVLLMKGACHSLTEGSVLLSVYGLSALSPSVLRFIADLPGQMAGQVVMWKFPRTEFQVQAVGISEPEAAPKRFTNPHAIEEEEGAPHCLHRVIIHKRKSFLMFGSDQEGGAGMGAGPLPSIIADLQRDIRASEGDKLRAVSAPPSAIPSTGTGTGSGTDPSLSDFLHTPAQVPWTQCRLMIAAGNASLLVTREGQTHTQHRLQLSSCTMKLVYPYAGQGMADICIHLRDAKGSVVLRCPDLGALLDLSQCLLVALKMMGGQGADLSRLYDQAVACKGGTQGDGSGSGGGEEGRSDSLLMQTIVSSTSAISIGPASSAIAPISVGDMGTGLGGGVGGMGGFAEVSADSSIFQAAEELEQTLSALHLPLDFPTAAMVEQQLTELFRANNANHHLLAEFLALQFDLANPEASSSSSSLYPNPSSNPSSSSSPSSSAVPGLAKLTVDFGDEEGGGGGGRRGGSIGAGGANVTPFVPPRRRASSATFRTPPSMTGEGEGGDEGQDMAAIAEAATAAAAIAATHHSLSAMLGNDEGSVGEGKEGEGGEGQAMAQGGKPNKIESHFADVGSNPTMASRGIIARRSSMKMRSGSVIMGSSPRVDAGLGAAPALGQAQASLALKRRATFRQSAANRSQEQMAVLLMSQLERQVLSPLDRSVVGVLLDHLRNNPSDLVTVACRCAPSDVAGLAHFAAHRLCVYWSADQAHLEGMVRAAAAAEASLLSGLSGSEDMSMGRHVGGMGIDMGVGMSSLPGGSFLRALLGQVTRRLDVVSFLQTLAGSASHGLTENSGVADICTRVVEPFCRRLEAAVDTDTVPAALVHTIKALLGCESSPIKPRDFLAECAVPHILNALLGENRQAEERGEAMALEQLLVVVDRVRDMVNVCFDQEVSRQVQICLSDQAALSRSKWFVERALRGIAQVGDDAGTGAGAGIGAGGKEVSPVARLAGIAPSGRTSAIGGLICVRPSELYFLLRVLDLPSAGTLSGFSRDLSQAVAHLQSADLVKRLFQALRFTPTGAGVSAGVGMGVGMGASTGAGVGAGELGILDEMAGMGSAQLDRECAFVLHISPHSTYHRQFMQHFQDEGQPLSPTTTLDRGKSPKNTGRAPFSPGGGRAGVGAEEHAPLMSDTAEESAETHALASARWLVGAARSALNAVYERSGGSRAGAVRELRELRQKLSARRGDIAVILNDWRRIGLCAELCANYSTQVALLLEQHSIRRRAVAEARSSVGTAMSSMLSNLHSGGSVDVSTGGVGVGGVSGVAGNRPRTSSSPSAGWPEEESLAYAQAMALTPGPREGEVEAALSRVVQQQFRLEAQLRAPNSASDSVGTGMGMGLGMGMGMAQGVQGVQGPASPSGGSTSRDLGRAPSRLAALTGAQMSPQPTSVFRAPNPLYVVMQSVFSSPTNAK